MKESLMCKRDHLQKFFGVKITAFKESLVSKSDQLQKFFGVKFTTIKESLVSKGDQLKKAAKNKKADIEPESTIHILR